jgi:hypothetical protein
MGSQKRGAFIGQYFTLSLHAIAAISFYPHLRIKSIGTVPFAICFCYAITGVIQNHFYSN